MVGVPQSSVNKGETLNVYTSNFSVVDKLPPFI